MRIHSITTESYHGLTENRDHRLTLSAIDVEVGDQLRVYAPAIDLGIHRTPRQFDIVECHSMNAEGFMVLLLPVHPGPVQGVRLRTTSNATTERWVVGSSGMFDQGTLIRLYSEPGLFKVVETLGTMHREALPLAAKVGFLQEVLYA